MLSLFDLISLSPHLRQKLIKAPAVGEHPVDGLPQPLLVAAAVLRRRQLLLLFGAGLWVLDHGEAVRPAQLVVEPPEDQGGVLRVLKFAVTVQVGAVELYMGVDMSPVHMSGDHELMLSSCELHSQLVSQAVGLLRGNLSGLEGMDDPVYEDSPARLHAQIAVLAAGDLREHLCKIAVIQLHLGPSGLRWSGRLWFQRCGCYRGEQAELTALVLLNYCRPLFC